MGYIKQTVKGVSWLGALRVIIRGLTFVRLAMLARILTPGEFGLFGIATLVLAFLEIITETGINVFFIQDEGKLKDYADTAWIVSIFRGIIISFSIVLFAPLISKFFNSPDSIKLLYFIAVIPLLRGFINPSIIKFQKEFEFNKEFFLRAGIFLIDSLVAVGLAFYLKTAISLVWGMVVGVLVEVIISQLFIKPRPRFSFTSLKFKKVLNRGKWVTASSILQYLFTNTDSMVIGKLLSSNSLGFYQMAYKISTLPITEISNVFYNVTFPVFSKFQNDKKRLKKAFLKSTLVIVLIAVPVGLAIYLFAKEIVVFILGKEWIPVVAPLKILSIYGILRAITAEFPAVFMALKKQELVTKVTLVAVLGIGITIIPFVRKFGILGASYSALFGMILAIPLMTYYMYILLWRKNGKH
ncbi:lipopolysaccharide biosynthesis protein [Patescibacteria group bacterium]|nr:lipopolysaccharide biosynthesis protein [Patescibacteria group bacterium]MBU2035977.1 lipopolysaccharide biosynthesis protein [Patescibacteria group bacterium]